MFPPEIWIIIFSFLSIKRQQITREVCKLFHSLIQKKINFLNINSNDVETLSNDEQYDEMIKKYIYYANFESSIIEICGSCGHFGYIVMTWKYDKYNLEYKCRKCENISETKSLTKNNFNIISHAIQYRHIGNSDISFKYKLFKFLEIFSKRKEYKLYFRFFYFIKMTLLYNNLPNYDVNEEIAFSTFISEGLIEIFASMNSSPEANVFSRGVMMKNFYLRALRDQNGKDLEILDKYCFKKLRKDCERILRKENKRIGARVRALRRHRKD